MNATALATLWVFIALVTFLAILLYKKVPAALGSALDSRSARIAKDLDEARKLREEAQALLAEYQRKRQVAEKEAEEIVALAKAEADRLVRDSETKLAESIARKTKAVEDKIAAAAASAEAEVRALAIDLAFNAATKVLQEKVQGDLAANLIASGVSEAKGRLAH